ncbi:hypothetical protein J1N35_045957 [Gossypium stocksii]|uniref:ABC transporter domain-containing protein n=1 Tax=Gossypium stocksii TaxID=47602 RepID=A0A9D3UCF3_9ROSI|nr:hypothetical protein J1N35_045957 [Gossypium stocksii]
MVSICRRYGLLGLNGCGESTLLAAIELRELPVPEHMDIYHLTREIEASDMFVLAAVISCDEKRKLPPPVLQFVEVTFGYTPDNLIYKNLEFGVDLDSRIAVVVPKGARKSILLKLMTGDLVPIDGMHLAEKLDLEMSALKYIIKEYPGNEEERMRAAIGKFGLSGKAQVLPMKNLSDGQRSRVIFAWLAYRQPHLLLLDEPTNHLNIETIDSLAEALNEWDGGLVLVGHDFRLINQVAEEIRVCENQTVTRWEGDIMDSKQHFKSKAGLSG